ncbi:MAG: anti-sigma factor [Dehalococcoidia bacterium]|nr:anti-sigma factor [Dehalococcoidia bacterium]
MSAAHEPTPHITQEQADEYAIGALEPEIAALITLHAEDCARCRALVVSSQRVASSFGLATPIRPAPPHLKRRVMSSAGIRRFGPLWTVMRFTPAAAAAAAIVVAVASFTGMVSLRGQVSDLRDDNATLGAQLKDALSQKIEIAVISERLQDSEQAAAELEQAAQSDRDLLVALLSPGSEVAELVRFDDGTSAVGRLVWDPEQRRVWFVANRLPPPAQGETYQIWLNSAGRFVSLGTFTPDSTGFARHESLVPEGLKTYDGAVITIERAGGAIERSGPSVFVADLSNLKRER